jgi:hypothetical protein
MTRKDQAVNACISKSHAIAKPVLLHIRQLVHKPARM